MWGIKFFRIPFPKRTVRATVVLIVCFYVISIWHDDGAAMMGSQPSGNHPVELHQLMAKQYDVQYGLYQHAPYKKILLWNDAVTLGTRPNRNFGMGVGRERYELAGCPVYQCETSDDRSDITQYDAILFNQRWWNGTDLPTVRLPHQRYIFFSHEPPFLPIVGDESLFFRTMSGPFFNWTMTYRWDSDVIHPYGWIEPINSLPLHPPPEVYEPLLREPSHLNHAHGRTKMAAMFFTNCYSVYSGRQYVMEELEASGIAIDKYGACGNLTCSSGLAEERSVDEQEECLSMASKNYKFYIAFHNSMCLDYVPERFFNAFRYSMIPVVLDSHENHARIAPPHSFINAMDFPSVPALAEYLIKLDKNDTLYNQYFWWKKHYRLRNAELYEGVHHLTYCSLCAALHDPARAGHQVYTDVMDWWRGKANCTTVPESYYDGDWIKV